MIAGRSPERVETDRILALPVVGDPDPEDLEVMSFRRLNAEAFDRGERLLVKQAYALREYHRCGGFVGPIGVGMGKSGIALMVAQDAIAAGRKRVILLTRKSLVAGLVDRHVREWRSRVNLPMTVHNLAGKTKIERAQIAQNRAPGLYVVPYSLLSTADTPEVLAALDADEVVADEAHRLKKRTGPAWRRLHHWMSVRAKAGRPVRFSAMSGTMTKRSLMDFHHMSEAALGDASPLPRSHSMAFGWGLVVDVGAEPPPGLAASAMGPIVRWAEQNFPSESQDFQGGVSGWRKAFRRRFVTAPGVVATGDERPAASLGIENFDPGQPGKPLKDLMAKVAATYETPDGEPIDHAMHVWKWLSELSCGLYLALRWQTPEALAQTRRISIEAAVAILDRARHHLEAQQDYHRELRDFFDDPPPGLETPREVASAIARGKITGVLADLWHQMRDRDFEGRPRRESVPVRLDDWKVRASARWASDRAGGIVWVWHEEVGIWAVETMRAAGLDPLWCPAGETAAAELEAVGDPVRGGKGDRICVASLGSHGEGRNLQGFHEALYLEWPRDASLAEQSLGRQHRTGQEADEVTAWTMMSVDFDHENRAATLNDATYVQQLSGSPQRVIYADYEPLPKIYSSQWLKERGANPLMLDARLRTQISEKFGAVITG